MTRTIQSARMSTSSGGRNRVGKRRATRAEKLQLSHPQNKLTRFQTKLLETRSFPLMKLPLELREMVYLHAMMPRYSSPAEPRIHAQDFIVDTEMQARLDLDPAPPNNSMALLRVNREINREAIEVFRKKFVFCLCSERCHQPRRIPDPVHYQGLRKISVHCRVKQIHGKLQPTGAQMVGEKFMRYWSKMLTCLRQVELYLDIFPHDIDEKAAEVVIVRVAKAFKHAEVTIKLNDWSAVDEEAPDWGELLTRCRQKIAQHRSQQAEKQKKIGASERVLRPRANVL